jgi:predicted AlkP superfamily phosphohydrolase/phosphomutase
LRELKDENGCPVFNHVWRKEELYQGSNLEEAPDIAYLPKEEFTVVLMPEKSGLFHEHFATLPGEHLSHPFGTLMIGGPNIKENYIQAEITDVLPTILYILGIPIPHEIDGRVLLEAFTDRFLHKKPVRYEDVGGVVKEEEKIEHVYTPQEEEEIKRRLRSLGYI